MKKITFVFILMAMLIFLSTTTSQAIMIGFDPIAQDVMLGDPFNVDVNIYDLGNFERPSLSTFDINFTYNPSVLGFNSVVFGTDLDILGFGLNIQGSIPGMGTLNIYELSFDSIINLWDFQPGSFTLASLTFDTLAYGSSPINIVSPVILGDVYGDPLIATTSNGSANVVPEPATIVLLGSGLAGLGFYRRKRSL